MTAAARRRNAPRPLPAAEVRDRAMVRAESAAFESSPLAQLAATAGVREWSQGCSDCGTVVVFTGTLDDWIDRAIAFDDTHVCDADRIAS